MQVFIRYEDEFGNLRDGTATLTLEEEEARLTAAERARLLGARARRILKDFGLDELGPGLETRNPEETFGPALPAPVEASGSTIDKAADFTTGTSPRGGETRGLEVWLVLALHAAGVLDLFRAKAIVRAINANPVATLPGRSLATGLFAEHIRSLLPNDVTQATPEELAALEQSKADFEQVVEDFLALEERVPLPDGRLHDDLDIRGGSGEGPTPEEWAAERVEVRRRLTLLEDWRASLIGE